MKPSFSNYFLVALFIGIVTILGFSGIPQINASTPQTAVQTSDDDEFKDFDESADFTDSSSNQSCSGDCSSCPNSQIEDDSIVSTSTWWIIAILLTTIITGVLVRFKTMRKFRYLFLLGSVAIFGVYRGTCPCMISSFENLILSFFKAEFIWHQLLWFVALIPITYLFGRVFCGWVCHLGALQELLYRPGKFRLFTSPKARIIMKIIQYALFALLVIQLIVQQEIFWCRIDPFLAIYQLMLAYNYEILSILLISILLLASLLSYRPFCRAACPVGLILGWIEKIPGAAIIGLKSDSCLNCSSCANSCKIQAIHKKEKITLIKNEECIMCGECLDSCSQSGLNFFRVSKKHPSTASFDGKSNTFEPKK